MSWQWQQQWKRVGLFRLNSESLTKIQHGLKDLATVTDLQFIEEVDGSVGVWQEKLLVLGYNKSLQTVQSDLSNLALYSILDFSVREHPNLFTEASIVGLARLSVETSAAIERL